MNIYIDCDNKRLMVVSITYAQLEIIFSMLEMAGYNPEEFTIEGIPAEDSNEPTDSMTYIPGTGYFPIFTFTS